MYEIRNVPIGLIDPNPHRDLATYPWIEAKIEHLVDSIQEVGFWASVIGRPKGRRYEMAFGHHRVEAGRRLKMKEVPLIVDELTDKQMLQYMGRENGEDYNTQFLVMLNTWDGAVKYLVSSKDYPIVRPHGRETNQSIDIARVLGWTEHEPKSSHGTRMSHVAEACAAAHALIQGGYISRRDLEKLTVGAARDILTRTRDRIEQLARVGKREGHKVSETRRAQAVVGRAAKITAREVREGGATRGLRNQVDLNVMAAANASKDKATPLFAVFGQNLCDTVSRMLNTDAPASRINQIVEAIPNIELEEDHAILRKLQHELGELGRRAERAKVRVTPNKVVKLTAIEQKGA